VDRVAEVDGNLGVLAKYLVGRGIPGRSTAPESYVESYTSASPERAKLATLLAMSASEQMPLADVKNRLSEVVDRLEREHGRVVITKHGRPAAVVLSIADLEGLEETLEILSDPALMQRVREGSTEIDGGEAEVLTKEEALARIRQR